MSPVRCSSCGSSRDPDDNFCRRCGRQITVTLPALREETLPGETHVLPPSLVSSIAVLAVGTGLEWLARRAAGGAARTVTRALLRRATAPVQSATPVVHPDAVSIDEVVYVRQVRLRR